ncbi:sulfotransferase family protein [Actinopolymorpha sp. B9G3]|uniref:sulfotransferase family protein n=1 Tax=Actinopolymorpha sp. B9G3 TaxID=3158970 RepID=UPI0032D9094D
MSDGLQVIGVGLHRTGSMSVKAALERLGFGPCYHGMEALRRSTDGDHWLAAYEAGGEFDWSVIFEGYRATLDWPTIYFWEQLSAAYPDAKILLTERDPELWWDSHVRMFQVSAELDHERTDEERQGAEESGYAQVEEALFTVVTATFDGQVFDKAHCLQVFEDHYERVRRSLPAERLLVYRVQEGWEPLCRFLGVDVPDEPFPRVNVGDDLRHNIRTAMRLARAQTGEAVWR